MTVQVIIRRTFNDDEKARKLAPCIVQLRSLASVQPGYISGETLRCLDCPGEYLVISTWNTIEDWNNWLNSEERKKIQSQVGFAVLALINAYRLARPSSLSPFEYFGIPFAFILGWFFFDEAPFEKLFPGVLFIVGGGMLIAWREHRNRRQPNLNDAD